MNLIRYSFSVLRFVPDPIRGEFINVGVIVGSDDSREWQIRTVDNNRRARYLDTDGILRNAIYLVDEWGRRIDRFTRSQDELFQADYVIDDHWLKQLQKDSQNVIQLSPPSIVLASDIEDAVDRIFEQMIIEPERTSRSETKNKVYSNLLRAYKRAGLLESDNVAERVAVDSGAYSGVFDFVVANGEAVQLAQAWSFQIGDSYLIDKVKSWAWTVHDIRREGATTKMKGRQIDVPRDIEIDVAYIPPIPSQRDTFQEAQRAFKEVGVNFYEATGADGIAQRAAGLIRNKASE